ncbi:hypothetical protein HID58_093679, partial [Brassica napus]
FSSDFSEELIQEMKFGCCDLWRRGGELCGGC